MNLDVKDEILAGEPKYRIMQNDTILYDDVAIEMTTEVQQQGTPINKALFDLVSKHLIPTGIICMWGGVAVPSGWHLCDGTNGTPDLRDRFIVGSGNSYSTGNKGGSNSVSLTISQMPLHNHKTKINSEEHAYWKTTGVHDILGTSDGELAIPKRSISYISNSYNFEIETSSTGTGTAHENRPPYYALAYIMKINE